MSSQAGNLVRSSGALLATLRDRRPIVQCVTNFVSMDLVANALHALGASPAMSSAPEEADEFAARAHGVVCNMGTLSRDRVESLQAVAAAAGRHRKPWVLDPVGVGATRFRGETAAGLLRLRPAAIRGNASEVMALARLSGVSAEAAEPRGVDAAHDPEAARNPAMALARAYACIVLTTGTVDLVTDGTRVVGIANGAPVMARVTAMGCALSGAVGAFLAITNDPFAACVAASAVFGVAGELAASPGGGPGTFRVNFLDRLFDLTTQTLVGHAKLAD